jgi:hypothetical protein
MVCSLDMIVVVKEEVGAAAAAAHVKNRDYPTIWGFCVEPIMDCQIDLSFFQ